MAVGTFPQSVALSADTTLGATHKNRVLDVTTGGSDVTLTVPAATTLADGEFFHARKADAAAGNVIFAGAFDYVLVNQDQYIAICSNATAYRILWHN